MEVSDESVFIKLYSKVYNVKFIHTEATILISL